MTVEPNEAAGEYELRCPICNGVGLVTREGVVCMMCKGIYIQFTHELKANSNDSSDNNKAK